jgi:hypothetical protein
MKKILFVLVALLFAAPALAQVNISAYVDPGDKCTVIIGFDATDEPNLVRAFALNIQADNDANIASVTLLSADYIIHPGTIVIDTAGTVTDYGSPVAPQSDLPSDTLEGPPDGNGVTIEMASLYAPVGSPANAPDPNGLLVAVTVDADCTLTITANVSRAGSTGVVMESPDEVVTVNLPPPVVVSGCGLCYSGMVDEDQWILLGQPTCWCYPRQCRGDADGLPYGKNNYWVSLPDLAVLKAAWGQTKEQIAGQIEPTTGMEYACADFDHLPYGKNNYRVSLPDLDILKSNWSDSGTPADCLPGNETPD